MDNTNRSENPESCDSIESIAPSNNAEDRNAIFPSPRDNREPSMLRHIQYRQRINIDLSYIKEEAELYCCLTINKILNLILFILQIILKLLLLLYQFLVRHGII